MPALLVFSLLNLIGFIIRLLPPLQFKSLSVSFFSPPLNPIKEIYHFYHTVIIVEGGGSDGGFRRRKNDQI